MHLFDPESGDNLTHGRGVGTRTTVVGEIGDEGRRPEDAPAAPEGADRPVDAGSQSSPQA